MLTNNFCTEIYQQTQSTQNMNRQTNENANTDERYITCKRYIYRRINGMMKHEASSRLMMLLFLMKMTYVYTLKWCTVAEHQPLMWKFIVSDPGTF